MVDVFIPQFHPDQLRIYKERSRFNRIRCGRRYGKTMMAEIIACCAAFDGKRVGWFVPQYKILNEAYSEIADILDPIKVSASEMKGIYNVEGGGRVDFWTLENERAGRSRKYHTVIIDEAAFTKPNMLHIWETSIKPTLLDYGGDAWVLSTPNGMDADNFFYAIGEDERFQFKDFHAPTHANPYLPAGELEKLERENHPLVFRQEYLAEFVDWSGVAFFSLDKMFESGIPVSYPIKCDAVYAVIDTAVKGGKDNDGTAIVYVSADRYNLKSPLTVLDWDIIQVDGALLENWMPSVFARLEELAINTGARYGVTGTFIEDAAAGSILIQQGRTRGWNTHAIDSKLTSAGKDERAISVSGYYHQELLKISQYAFDKTVNFKNQTRNHLLTQVTGFRIGDKDAYKRADDLLDAFVYAIAIGVGDKYGY